MKVSINWIKDFVDLSGVNIEELINKFTMGVAEVEGIEYKGRDISGVVTAKILSVENVPNSNKLHLLKVDCGEETAEKGIDAETSQPRQRLPPAGIQGRMAKKHHWRNRHICKRKRDSKCSMQRIRLPLCEIW